MNRTRRFAALALASLAGCGAPADRGPRGFWFPDEGRIVELSRPFDETAGARVTTLAIATAGATPSGSALASLDRLEPGRCVAPLVVIDVRARCLAAPELTFGTDDLAEFEGRRGEVPQGAVVILATGGGQLEPASGDRPARWRNAGFAPAAVELLVRQRGALGIGTDAPALDPSSAASPEAARAANAAGGYVLTNLARLDQIADGRAIVVFSPPLERVASAPVRVFAIARRTVGRG